MTARWNELIDMQNPPAHQRQSPLVMAISKPSVIAALVCTVLVPSLIPAGHVDAQPAGQWVVPAGFQVTVFAENVENAREMALGPRGTVFVGSMRAGKVHAVVDRDGDHRADRVVLIASGLDQPNGVAIRNGALYVATASKILRFDDIERRLDSPPAPVVVRDSLPNPSAGHTWKFIACGPDDRLYMGVGAPWISIHGPLPIWRSMSLEPIVSFWRPVGSSPST